jgi:hypothetical protein
MVELFRGRPSFGFPNQTKCEREKPSVLDTSDDQRGRVTEALISRFKPEIEKLRWAL